MIGAGPLRGEKEADAVVVGAGLTGCVAALAIARGGGRVLLLDSGAAGGEASPAGQVAPGPALAYTEAIDRWGRGGARELWETHREGHARVRELLDAAGDECDYHAAGAFLLAADRGEALALAESEDLLREDGFSGEFLDHYLLEARFPVRGFAAAYWSLEGARLDLPRLVTALARAAAAAGVVVHEQTEVLALPARAAGVEAVTSEGRARGKWALVAAGAAGGTLSAADPPAGSSTEVGLLLETGQAPVPGPGQVLSARIAWSRTAEGLAVTQADGARTDLARWARDRFSTAGTRVIRAWTARRTPAGELPIVASLDGRPGMDVKAGGGRDAAWGALVGLWAAEAFRTGRDPTPAAFRAPSRGPV